MGSTAARSFLVMGDATGLVSVEPSPSDGFYRYLVEAGLSERTIAIYERYAQRACDELGSAEALFVADGVDLSGLSKIVPNSAPSRRQLRTALKYWYAYMGRYDAPIKAVRVPPKPKPVYRGISTDKAKALVETASGWYPQGTAVLFGMYAALRRAEIARVRWDRFDAGLEWYTVMGKADRTHTIPVHPVLAAELQELRTGYVWLFPGSKNRAFVTPATINVWTEEVTQAAGIGHITPHQLRHTAIAAVHDGTGDLRAASEFARHANIETTRIYTHTTAAKLRAAVESIDYFGSAA